MLLGYNVFMPELPHPPSSDRDAWEEIAKNPEPGRVIYRGERRSRSPLADHPDPPVQGRPQSEDDEVGLHWTVNAPYAMAFGHRESEQDSVTYRAVIDDPEGQVIPFGHTPTYSVTRARGFKVNPRMGQGALREGEVRLRPGAKIRMLGEQWGGQDEETVLPEGTFKTVSYPTRQPLFDPTNEVDPNMVGYLGLAKHSVPGTPQRRQHEDEEALLPQTQGALFQEFKPPDAPATYIPSSEAVGWDAWHEDFQNLHDTLHKNYELGEVKGSGMSVELPHWTREETQTVPRHILERIKDTRDEDD